MGGLGGLCRQGFRQGNDQRPRCVRSEGTYAFALNVAYELVPGFTITPEINYTKFEDYRQPDGTLVNDDALGGIIRFQRNF